MSEMLGNQYFLSRKFSLAIPELEEALTNQPANKPVQKKLIICYTQVGNVNKAMKVFHNLISSDIEFIINTDIIEDDCPCPELVSKSENSLPENSLDYYLILGILWLYCNVNKSYECFEKAQSIDQNNPVLNAVSTLIKSHISNIKFKKISN